MGESGGDRAAKPGAAVAGVRRYQQKLRRYQQMLEQRPQVAFLLQAARRFKEIEGKHLALVISLNLFIAVIPLLIIIYAFAQAFSPHRSFGALVVKDLHLTGSSALIVRDTFSNASSGKSVALSISLISLLITGLDVSATAQLAYARAFSMTPLRGLQKYLRGAGWLVLLLAFTVAALALRALAAGRPFWVTLVAAAALLAGEFVFFLISPRLLLELPFKWRDLVPGAAVCTVAALIVHAVTAFFLRNWVAAYGHAYGGFGVSLALIAAVGIIASFWVWIAAVMSVYWEHKAGPAAVAAMEELSAEISASEQSSVSGKPTMGQLKPLVISESDVARDSWDDPAKGVLGFRTLFSGGTTATQALTAGIADLNAGDWLGLHRHTPAEIYYVVEGHGTVTLDGDDYPVSAGTAVYIPGDTEHGIRNIGPAPLRFFYAFAADSFDDVTYRFSQ